MGLTNAARNYFSEKVIGGTTTTAFNTANAYIGVGESTVAFAATQTDLQGATKTRKLVDTAPTSDANGAMTFRATFGTADANIAWNEWGVFNAATAGTMLNRRVEALGTKPNTQTWQFTVTISPTVPAT